MKSILLTGTKVLTMSLILAVFLLSTAGAAIPPKGRWLVGSGSKSAALPARALLFWTCV